jgi:tetratricopeptide (TPR) repeat protein
MTRSKITLLTFSIALIALSSVALCDAYGEVRIWEEELVIPSYEILEAERLPRFYEGRVYQGAQGRVYPYPMSDRLTSNLNDQTYDAVYLENEYVKISVLPEIGGRIFTAVDKTNGYDIFYRQHVIKPALIGMLGAWISGGVEWNFPHHHRARTYMPMDYQIIDNADGSKTLWLNELERRHRMRFMLGLTLHPGKSYIQATIKMINRTPYVNSFLYFANPSVHVDDTYQVLFAPDVEFVTQHAKREFSDWPVSNNRYGGRKYDDVDISWWKNLPSPVSFFCWNYDADYFAGYDRGKKAGVAYVSNHHIAPGMKFFTFGCGNSGKTWDKMLTDEDGPYLELMAGGYSDNQPDYSWGQPFETKTVNQYWFPLRELADMKYANLEGAVHLKIVEDQTAEIRINSTSERKNAKVVLYNGDKVLFDKTINICPAQPFSVDVKVSDGIEEGNLKLVLKSVDGEILLQYSPIKQPGKPMPDPVKPPKAPEKIETIEELYLAGLRLDLFHNAKVDSMPYYEEALRRDPGDARVNTQVGILYSKRGLFAEAEEKLTAAVERLSRNYTRVKDGEAFYYLGGALKAQHKYKAAYDAYYRASWSLAWHSASYYSLAQLDCLAGNYDKALDHLQRSINTNALNTKALNLKAAVLRRMERYADAERLIAQYSELDLFDYWTLNERVLTHREMGMKTKSDYELKSMSGLMKDPVQTHLELAVDYSNCGLWDEAIDVLQRVAQSGTGGDASFPMVYYYLGYFYNQQQETGQAAKYFKQAADLPPDYCFPFRLESIDVLQCAMTLNPQDALAPYYLGNLLYDRQPEKAVEYWEQARQMNCPYYALYRNLAYAYAKDNKNIDQAIALMERSIELNASDPRAFFELDKLYEKQGALPDMRVKLMTDHHDVILQRDDALQREIKLFVLTREYDRAVDLLTNHNFHTWEGGGLVHNIYVNAFLLRGLHRMAAKDYDGALQDFEKSLIYPDNLEVAKPYVDDKAPRAWHLMGLCYDAMGDAEQAKTYFEKSYKQKHRSPEIAFYRALSYHKTGQQDEAVKMFDELIKSGNDMLKNPGSHDFFAKFGERQSPKTRRATAHYIIGLGYLGNGEKGKAKDEFEQSLSLDINQAWTQYQMDQLK